ncbi:hypothetical protein PUN4_280240 [Paraburkholderia unamae]|nr:hypothetical protein PUN4_280240 [Paraburkholderia unamae]
MQRQADRQPIASRVTVAPLNRREPPAPGRAARPQTYPHTLCTEFRLRYTARNMALLQGLASDTASAAVAAIVPTDAPDSNQANATLSIPGPEQPIFCSATHACRLPRNHA